MARYFIHLRLRVDHIPDVEDVELVTLSAAFDVALTSAKRMVAVDLMQSLTLSDALDGTVESQDETAAAVAAWPLREATETAQRQSGRFSRF